MNLHLLAKPPATTRLDLGGRDVEVEVRISPRARSYRLSLPHGGRPVLTMPRAGKWTEAQAFLHRHAGWLRARLAAAPPVVMFIDGESVPLRGVPHRIVATGALRGAVRIGTGAEGPTICVPGLPEHHARRLTDWLKREAARDLAARAAAHAKNLGVAISGISIRSPRSRWGSCSSRGRLNFNWRLILAPPFVLDYVAAHEVAHLIEMNHSPAFWRVVSSTMPEVAEGRAWLKRHGATLMAYGG